MRNLKKSCLQQVETLWKNFMKVDQKLVNAAIEFVKNRFPGNQPFEGAAAMYTDDGSILISSAPETINSSVSLCHETGAICEAYKLNKRITATVCVSRDEKGNFIILTPCGVCQERLMYWGADVQAAVPSDLDSTQWIAKTLGEIQPYYWAKVLKH
jgi:cytidine deaminase